MSEAALIDELLDPLTRCLDTASAQRVSELRMSPVVQERISILAERANEGLLEGDERADYEALISASDFVAILKLKAKRSLNLDLIPNSII